MSVEKVIECCNLTKKFNMKTALNNLTFSLDENKIIGLIGRNGAGKTTFLKTCAGYIKPSAGSITIWGEKVFNNIDVLSNMIFVDEEIQYDTSSRLKDIIDLGKTYYKSWDNKFALKLARYFNLDLNLKYKKLSRGMKTQFNIIMGLSSRSPLTLLDEPTLGLDAAIRKEFYNILLKDYMENPRTIIISSHLLSEIESLLEEIVLIKEGSLVLHESVETVQEYGIYLNGKKDIILPFIQNKEVLNVEVYGNDAVAAIKNDLNKNETTYLSENSIDISKVPMQDVCIFLTKSKREGGFDEFEA